MGFNDSLNTRQTKSALEFLNRNSQKEKIYDALDAYLKDEIDYKLFLIWGMGGIGKTSLLNEVENHLESKIKIVRISLDLLKYDNMINLLLSIRKKFSKAPTFDYFFLKYWDCTKSEQLDTTFTKLIKNQIINEAIEYSSILLSPIAFAKTIIEKFPNYWNKVRDRIDDSEYQKYLDNIAADPIPFVRLLPQILANDIEKDTEKNIFIFDNHENIELYSDYDWLYDFINAFSNGVFIVTSRERLAWLDNYHSDKAENMALDSLPSHDVTVYLHSKNIEKKHIEKIIRITDCIPFYLNIAMNLYLSREEIDMNIFLDSKKELVDTFLNHLQPTEQKIIELLSVIGIFDQIIYEQLLHANDISYIIFPYDEFCQKSILVEKYDLSSSLYIIHPVIAENIIHILNQPLIKGIIHKYSQIVRSRIIYLKNPSETIIYIKNSFQLANRFYDILDSNLADSLFDLTLFMIDTGWIFEFYESIIDLTIKEAINDIILYINSYIERQKNIQTGINVIEKINLDTTPLLRHKKTIECDKVYMYSLLGNYRFAEQLLTEFYNKLTVNDKSERYYLLASTYYADMLMLKGDFIEAVRVFNQALDGVATPNASPRMIYEVYKAIGHCYRFNFMFDESIGYYEKFKGNINETLNMKAYRLTTTCEAKCYTDPEYVKKFAADAIEINKNHSINNVAKTYYALAISLILLHEYDEADTYIQSCLTTNRNSGYKAGQLFGLLSLAYKEFSLFGRIAKETITKIESNLTEIEGVYTYLMLPIYVIQNDDKHIQKIKTSYGWLDFDTTIRNIHSFITKLKPNNT